MRNGFARDLHLEIRRHQPHRLAVHDLERHGRPLAFGDIGRPNHTVGPVELDSNDARGQNGDGDLKRAIWKLQGRRMGPIEPLHCTPRLAPARLACLIVCALRPLRCG